MKEQSTSEPQTWREGRRLRAWALQQEGWSQRQIARALGVTDGAVSQWLKRARQHGSDALHHRRPPGRPQRLSEAQRADLIRLLERGAEAFGYTGAVWTTTRVAEVIACELGVRYHPAHVSRLLRRLDWSVQKPIQRASQRDEVAIAAWQTDRWPALKKKPRPRAAPSSG
jgi:transposase